MDSAVNISITKTVDVPKETLRWFRAYVKSFRYLKACVADSGLNVATIKSIRDNGTCHANTLVKIEELKSAKEAIQLNREAVTGQAKYLS